MPKKLADNVTVDCQNRELLIDGEKFPYFVEDVVKVDLLSDQGLSAVTVTILARSITVRPVLDVA